MTNWGYVPATLTTLPFPVTTHAQTGAAVAPNSAFEAADFLLYKNGNAAQRSSTSGWTIASPFDSITGLHMLLIDLTDNTDAGFYSAGGCFTLVLSPDETVDGLAVVRVVGTFILGPQAANVTQLLGTAWLTPGTAGTPDVNAKLWNGLTTVALPLIPTTAGRTLDVSAGGEAGVDWANVGSPTTSLALTGTTIAVTQKVDVDTIKTNPVVNGGTITFPTTATLASTTNLTAGTITTVSGNVSGNVGGSVASVTGLTASDVGAIKTKTDFLPSVTAGNAGGVFIAGTNAATTITTALTTTFTGNLTGSVDSVTTKTGYALTSAYDFAKGTVAVTESYAANGAAPTPVQAMMASHQMLMQFAISSTSYTVKKLDGSTTAFVVTLDSATAPTSAARL